MEDLEADYKQIHELMRVMSEKIGDAMPAGWGFTLLMFSYGSNAKAFYQSSAMRADMIKFLKEMITKLEAHG